MNIIFLTVCTIKDIEAQNDIYSDLLRKLRDEGHNVYILSPRERRLHEETNLSLIHGAYALGVKTLNVRSTNVIEKGVGTIMLESQLKRAAKKYLKDIQFDLILYATPPITVNSVVKYLKKHSPRAKSYLMLKDIFPQNAVDLGVISRKGFIYKYFARKEKQLYNISDFIGCMSPANVEYILKHNPEIDKTKVEICPNAIKIVDNGWCDKTKRDSIRQKYGIPTDKTIFLYGGNLGKPQGMEILPDYLEANEKRDYSFFLIVGDGTEYPLIKNWMEDHKPKNSMLLRSLPGFEYYELVSACDVGLIFLDRRFTIPNYPSRLLPYLNYHMPVICVTDKNTDLGKIATENNYGVFCENGSLDAFNILVDEMKDCERIRQMGDNGFKFLCENYSVEKVYDIVMKHFEAD